jgi:hypothetical protein
MKRLGESLPFAGRATRAYMRYNHGMRKFAAWLKSELAGWGRAIRANPGSAWIRVGLVGLVVLDLVALPRLGGNLFLDQNGLVQQCIHIIAILGLFVRFSSPLKLQLKALLVFLISTVGVWSAAFAFTRAVSGSHAEGIQAAETCTLLLMMSFGIFGDRVNCFIGKSKEVNPQ